MTRTIKKRRGEYWPGNIGVDIADHCRHSGASVFVWNRTRDQCPTLSVPRRTGARRAITSRSSSSDDDALADDPDHFDCRLRLARL